MGGRVDGRTVPDLSNTDVSSQPDRRPRVPRHLDGGVPGGGEEPLLPPAHLADGVVVAHQGVLTSPVRDRVEVAEGTETCGSHAASQGQSRLPVPLTCCCPRKNTPQFSPQPASDTRTAPGDEGQRVRQGGRGADRGRAAAVYHVREGDAPLEVPHLLGEHLQAGVWNKDTFPGSSVVLQEHQLRGQRGRVLLLQSSSQMWVLELKGPSGRSADCWVKPAHVYWFPET